jgi:hypothetical protein
VSLSVGAVVAEQLDTGNIPKKLSWMDAILQSLHRSLPNTVSLQISPAKNHANLSPQDAQIRDVVPNIMGQFQAGLERLHSEVSRKAPSDPYLKPIGGLIHMTNTIRDMARDAGRYHGY